MFLMKLPMRSLKKWQTRYAAKPLSGNVCVKIRGCMCKDLGDYGGIYMKKGVRL